MSNTAPRGVIFDVDGVLFDSAECHRRSWYAVAEELNLSMCDAFFYDTFGQTNTTILKRLLARDLDPKENRRLSERKEDLFRAEARGGLQLFPGVTDRLRELRSAGFQLALGTSAPRSNVDFFQQELGLARYVETFVCMDDICHGKPDPEVFLLAAKRLGLTPDRCVVVEDAVAGVQAAKAGGFKCIAVTTTTRAEVLCERSTPDLVLTATAEVTPEIVTRLLDGAQK